MAQARPFFRLRQPVELDRCPDLPHLVAGVGLGGLLVEVVLDAVEVREDAVLEEALSLLVQRRVVVLEREDAVSLRLDDVGRDGLLGAHRVDGEDAALPLQGRHELRMAVISLDFSPAGTCPSTRRFAVAQALTRWMGPRLLALSLLRRTVPPSMATTSSSTISATVPTHRMKLAEKASELSIEKTRQMVSCDGMPFGWSRILRIHSSLAFPKSSICTKPSAPQMTARTLRTKMSRSEWRRVRAKRGSGMSSQYSRRVGMQMCLDPHRCLALGDLLALSRWPGQYAIVLLREPGRNAQVDRKAVILPEDFARMGAAGKR